jgi:hypothetical protein
MSLVLSKPKVSEMAATPFMLVTVMGMTTVPAQEVTLPAVTPMV